MGSGLTMLLRLVPMVQLGRTCLSHWFVSISPQKVLGECLVFLSTRRTSSCTNRYRFFTKEIPHARVHLMSKFLSSKFYFVEIIAKRIDYHGRYLINIGLKCDFKDIIFDIDCSFVRCSNGIRYYTHSHTVYEASTNILCKNAELYANMYNQGFNFVI